MSTCNDLILQKSVSRANSIKRFSILADETTNIDTNENCLLCVGYVDET